MTKTAREDEDVIVRLDDGIFFKIVVDKTVKEQFLNTLVNNALGPELTGYEVLNGVLEDGRRVRLYLPSGMREKIPFLRVKNTNPDPKGPQLAPCPTCDEKTFGVNSLLTAVSGPQVSDWIAEYRQHICENCQEKDSETGEQLYRFVDGLPFCGIPRPFTHGVVPSLEEIKNAKRNDFAKGCGCNLEQKVKYALAECPRKKWLQAIKG
jgi:hypothetical protein